ncbi:MAG: hypothetical protein P8105_06250, partial [Dehalococcoidia bacterium]
GRRGWRWWGHWNYEKYHYQSSHHGSGPKVEMWLDFDRGTWSVTVMNVDASSVDNSDGVDVSLMIGELLGSEHIEMNVTGLTY